MTRVSLNSTSDITTIPSPATGLLVYNTNTATDVTPGFYYWDGSRWVRLLNAQSEDWKLVGNAGTNPAVNFLGTTDAQPLVFRTNNTEKMRISTDGNVGIGTAAPQFRLHLENDGMIYARGALNIGAVIPPGAKGTAFIWNPRKGAIRAGFCSGNQWDDSNVGLASVALGYDNSVPALYGVVAGGVRNVNNGYAGIIAGGWENRIVGGTSGGHFGVIGGGYKDTVNALYCVVVGGRNNRAGTPGEPYGFVGGGSDNKALALYATIGGGTHNIIATAVNHYWATIAGGGYNFINGLGPCFIGGGGGNRIEGGWIGTIAGGAENIIGGNTNYCTIGGGLHNKISQGGNHPFSVICGGDSNLIIGGHSSVICGGRKNTITEAGSNTGGYNAILGGVNNEARGWMSTVLGGYNNFANGYYIWTFGSGMKTTSLSAKSVLFGYNNGTATVPADHDFLIAPVGETMQLAVNMHSPWYAFQLPNNTTNTIGRARANAWTTYSDKRVKSHITTISNASEKILQMNPVYYFHHNSDFQEGKLNIHSEGKYMYGFLAQELAKVLPEAVDKPENENKELWGVNYDLIIPVLVKALQEQIQEIEKLRNANIELRSEIENLKTQFFTSH